MEPITTITSRTLVLPRSDVDTDQIIPARFLRTTTREGLGLQLFSDWRYLPDGSPNPEFELNKPQAQGCKVLVAGDNFGCGSSREHAPWALTDHGIRVVISTSFADIFRSNSLKNGLVPVVVDAATLQWLLANPGIEVTLDLATSSLRLPGGRSVQFPIEPFSRYCLMQGVDQLGYLLSKNAEISAYEQRRAAR
ncbi:MAG: 3-isopropylmalate dehydratase small subunit [Proteobacteria bacterium]|jgi:3-isopropylmalate/(R)-2-methylmalate dehydratase small subunit|nr:3-isopropylmalate dehydratase small subunit [Pseudomonadota bacterium]MBK9253220.1 3-isopropylmalate dehydratase small subunit [Pseudomonadota bacterium]